MNKPVAKGTVVSNAIGNKKVKLCTKPAVAIPNVVPVDGTVGSGKNGDAAVRKKTKAVDSVLEPDTDFTLSSLDTILQGDRVQRRNDTYSTMGTCVLFLQEGLIHWDNVAVGVYEVINRVSLYKCIYNNNNNVANGPKKKQAGRQKSDIS